VIRDETIAAVKERVDLVALVREHVQLTRAGRSFKGLCPFHREKTPSFHVNPERRSYHCFGCSAHGGAIDFVMQLEGLAFPEAVRALGERYGIEVLESGSSAERGEQHERRRERDELYGTMRLAAVYFAEQLVPGRGHPLAALARAELARRALAWGGSDATVAAALAAFQVGYAPYGWDGLASYLARQGLSPLCAEKLGLVVARRGGGGYYDAFRHRLMFAVTDHTGRVVAFSGRALGEPQPAELAAAGLPPMHRAEDGQARPEPPKYVNSPESPIYVKGETLFGLHQARQAIRREGRAVLVEGNFDVVSLHARGLTNVVAPLGTAFTDAQARLVRRYGPEIVVLFDGDSAGRKAAAAARVPARAAGLGLKVAVLPDGTDPDAFIRSRGGEAVAKLVGAAEGMLDFLIRRELELGRGGSLQDRQQCLRRVQQYIAEEDDPALRAMAKAYADKLAPLMVADGQGQSDTRVLEQLVRAALGGATAPASCRAEERAAVRGPSARSRPRPEAVGLAVLGVLLDLPELFDDPEVGGLLDALEGDIALAVAAVRRLWETKKTLEGAENLDLKPEAIHAFAVGRLVAPKFADREEGRAELLDNGRKLQRLYLKGDGVAAREELAQAGRLGDSETEDSLLREISRRSRKKHGLTRD
jgi:DNA primase